MTWATGPMTGYDSESTGTQVDTDRIVSAAVVRINSGGVDTRSALINPGVDIPADATAIHGITNERARAEGKPPASELEWIADALTGSWSAGVPVVGMNLCFDLTLLDRELRRHGLLSLADRLGREPGPVIDVFVIDKTVDRYRPGKRNLKRLCLTYGVHHGGAHDAIHDTLAACQVAARIGGLVDGDPVELRRRYADRPRQSPHIIRALRSVADMSLADLHAAQRRWYAEQSRDFAAYLRNQAAEEERRADRSDDPAVVEAARGDAEALRKRADEMVTDWPILPWAGGA